MNVKYFFPVILLSTLSFLMISCLKEDELVRPFGSFKPVAMDDGWVLSCPSAENVDSLELVKVYKDVYDHEKAWTLKSMLVFRNGKLIAESYLKDDSERTHYNAIWSCTKQVTAIVTGIAINNGFIQSVNDPISKYIPGALVNHGDKKDITLAQLLTMRSGIYFDNDKESDIFRAQRTENSVDYVLGNELKWQPGTHYQYNDGNPQIVSAVVKSATGMTLAQYAENEFFSKIGLTNYEWKDYPDGITLGAFGLMMPARELAKIAQCVCDSGMWNNLRVIPLDWLKEMLTIRVPQIHEDVGFGYYWWISDVRKMVHTYGHGGQYSIIYPSKHLIVQFTALEQIGGDVGFSPEEIYIFSDRINSIAF